MSHKPDCIFCKIIQGEIPCDRVYNDDMVMAFRDINPQAKVHIVVVPKFKDFNFASGNTAVAPHCVNLTDMAGIFEDREDIAYINLMLPWLMKYAAYIGRDECPDGYRLVINNGPDAGQEVQHLHVHILGGEPLGGI